MLDVTGDASHKSIPVFKVGVKICLPKERQKGVKRLYTEKDQSAGDDGRWQRWRHCEPVRTWYIIEEGGGSMHGCWSGSGSSSSRSTLDRASSRVTWVVMVTRCHSNNAPG